MRLRRHRRRADGLVAGGIGGTRNSDYCYCWLRDATLTLLAFMDADFYDESSQFWNAVRSRFPTNAPNECPVSALQD